MSLATRPRKAFAGFREAPSAVRAKEVGVATFVGLLLGTLLAHQFSPSMSKILQLAIGALVIAALLLAAWHNPSVAVAALLIGIPFHQLLFARLYALGVDVRFLALGRYWKELVITVLAARMATARDRSWATVDYVVMAFLGVIALYIFIPLGPPLFAKLLAARIDAVFLVLFLVGRHAPDLDTSPHKLETIVLVVGAILAGFAFWNAMAPGAFEHWLGSSTGLARYRSAALDLDLPLNPNLTTEGGDFQRVGSLFGNALSLAHYLLIPLGLVLGRAVRGLLRPAHVLTGLVCAAALTLTLTRSAILAFLLMIVLSLALGTKRTRVAVAIVCFGLFALFIQALPGRGRLSLTNGAAPSSNADHIAGLRASVQLLTAHPFGTGLGTAGPQIRRFNAPGLVNESWYFQIGNEVGIVTMLLFLVIVLMVLRELRQRARAPTDWAVGPLCALAGVSFGALVLHVFGDLAVAWTVWLAAGLALRSRRTRSALLSQRVPSIQPVHT